MITRGSKLFFSAALIGLISGLFYGFVTAASATGGVFATLSSGGVVEAVVGPITFGWKGSIGDHVGYSVLMAFAAVMALMGALTTATRDADVQSIAIVNSVPMADVAPPVSPVGYSIWPLVAAVSAALVAVGTAFSTFLLFVGLVGIAAAALEWVVRSSSEFSAGDADADDGLHNQILAPVELPVVVALTIGVVAVAMSRVLLAVSEVGAVFVIIIVAVVVFGLANLLARRPELTRSVLVTVLVVGGVVLIGSGIAAGIAGQRDIEEHHGEEGAISLVESPTIQTSLSSPPSVGAQPAGTSGY